MFRFNPWFLVVALMLVGSAFILGMKAGKDSERGKQARLEQTLAEVERRTHVAVAEEVAKIEIKNVTIRHRVEEKIREVPTYRDCVNDPDVQRMLDAARTGQLPAPGNIQLP